MRNKIIRVLPIVTTAAIMVMIFMFSAQNSEDSSEVSGGLIKRILELLPFTAHLAYAQKEQIVDDLHNIVRKCAHFTIYSALGFSACAMFSANMRDRKKVLIWAMSAALCCLYAATDEFHQTFISGRSGELRDILIDTCGGGTGAAVMLLAGGMMSAIKKRRRRR